MNLCASVCVVFRFVFSHCHLRSTFRNLQPVSIQLSATSFSPHCKSDDRVGSYASLVPQFWSPLPRLQRPSVSGKLFESSSSREEAVACQGEDKSPCANQSPHTHTDTARTARFAFRWRSFIILTMVWKMRSNSVLRLGRRLHLQFGLTVRQYVM